MTIQFFSEDVFPILNTIEYDHVVLGGDWNLGRDTDIDYLEFELLNTTENCIRVAVKKPGDCGIILEGKQTRRPDLTTF